MGKINSNWASTFVGNHPFVGTELCQALVIAICSIRKRRLTTLKCHSYWPYWRRKVSTATQTRLDAAHVFDVDRHTCVIDASTPVGRDLNRLFAGFIQRSMAPTRSAWNALTSSPLDDESHENRYAHQDSVRRNWQALPHPPLRAGRHRQEHVGSQATKPFFVQLEYGSDEIGCDRFFSLATKYEDVITALRKLRQQDHPYETVVIDSLDWL